MIVIAILVAPRLVPAGGARAGGASARTRRCRTTIAVGDEIITAGGMHAIVREASEDELRIEIAPGVVVTLDRRAVAAVGARNPCSDEQDPNNKNDPPAS